MAESNRLNVLIALTEHLKSITVANGYEFNVGPNVFRGRTRFDDTDPATMLSILEAPRPDNAFYTADDMARLETWTLLLQGWCPDDTDNPSDAVYRLMADVELCLSTIIAERPGTGLPYFPAAYMLGGRITRITWGPGVVRPPTEGVSSKAFFYLPVRVGLAERVG